MFALRRVFETIGLIFVRARFERSKILLDQYQEVDFAIYLLDMVQSDLLGMRPSLCQAFGHGNLDFTVSEAGRDFLLGRRSDHRVAQMASRKR